MAARGDQKIHTFYCWRLKESTPALARQQALALAAQARASQTTEACFWAHRLSLRGLQQVSVNQGLVIAGKKFMKAALAARARARHGRRKLVPGCISLRGLELGFSL